MEVLEATVTVDDLDAFVARLGEIGDEHGVAVQALDARYVIDREHLQRAVELADRAFERGENIADERSVEVLLYAAATRQISRALELGVETGGCPAVIVVHDSGASDGVDSQGDETAAIEAVRALSAVQTEATLGNYDERRVREWFEITDPELATGADLSALVRERVALLVVEK
ncbi:KEOPS complex subunit Cgi121 [Halapricum desulfuricans]|uniref:Subunit of KEOPS complex (Cgi121BUD32KAE1) n=1 Tax=Halapricum desulfuricans TaxID=2841257 RepID=A0A897NFD6_9EURY|nr:KEOPS complex subunit Cgi121 [Halapricum desulfuricans]QSG10135.1 Subunit of KEOPS complex (Cgi121BUD32KAE1) [Halapricum desulfuricans]